jgi:tetratricopeptide (TPR) repeat protein
MLGYIIPPIIIVLSLAALIIFLFRKSAKISEELILEEKRKEAGRAKKRRLFKFTQFVLRILEKGMQYFKLFSLKFYNKFDGWFHSIKEKREKRSVLEKGSKQTKAEKDVNRREYPREFVSVQRETEVEIGDMISAIKEGEEMEVEPMISKEVTQPDSRIGARNEFERALIDRIAFNPKDIEAYERLGDYYVEIGNFNDSLSCFEEILKLSPANRKAKIKIRRLRKIAYINRL